MSHQNIINVGISLFIASLREGVVRIIIIIVISSKTGQTERDDMLQY